ncbi:TPA: hypothetical protein ACVOYM_002902 [Vibrio diabolicus]|uniref:hypothetical protein n=3 Tax=Vibrio diabolicus TaxID=50719 RepID=UPI00215D07F2|nr:hypothetical protein [Vibrio diabolicus]MCR9306193.1 hypothetical protein [Vibrio diabolicus]MCS0385396.1 hypothetical protein [Vibrio diabolicus]
MHLIASHLLIVLTVNVLSIFLQTFIIGIMHLTMPKAITIKYFKEPYFNEFELSLFTGWPYAFFRTLMFARLIFQPNSGKKRGLPDISNEVPSWYFWLAKGLIWMILINTFVMAAMLLTVASMYIIDTYFHY